MKNLNELSVLELNSSELESIEGGVWPIIGVAAGLAIAAVAIGNAAGRALYYATH